MSEDARRCRDCIHCDIDDRPEHGGGTMGWCRKINADHPVGDDSAVARVMSYEGDSDIRMQVDVFYCQLWERLPA